MSRLADYVNEMLSEVECSREERMDMKEEMLSHLQEAKRDYIAKGMSEEDAEREAIRDFGGQVEVGEQLQHSMNPFRKELMWVTGLGTITFSALTFLHMLFRFGTVHYIWLALSLVTGSVITLFAMNPSAMSGKKLLINGLLLSLNIYYIFGFIMLDTSKEWYASILNILAGILMILSIVMVFMTALKQPVTSDESKKTVRAKRVLHVVNLIAGLLVIGYSIFFFFGMLFFVGLSSILLIPIGLIVGWGLIYFIQYKLVKNYPKAAIVVGTLFFVATASVITFIYI